MGVVTLSDDRTTLNLFEECYAESVESLKEQTRVDSPYPPFEAIEYPETVRLNQDMYDGHHWARMPKMPKWKSRPVKNTPFQVVESQTTFLTDNRPAAAILPRSPEDAPIAELVQAAVDFWWDEQNMDRKLMDTVKMSRIHRIGWLYLYWDEAKKQHVCKTKPMWSVKVDPDVTADDYDPTYLIDEFKTTLGELKSKEKGFNKPIDWTKFDLDYRPLDGKMFDEVMYDADRPRALQRHGITDASPTWCYRFWLRDGAADDVEKDIGNGKVAVVRKKKYPNGRVITVAGGMVLDDRPSPYRHGQFPYIPYMAYPVPGKFYGPGDIDNIMSNVVYRNRTMQIFYDTLEKSMGAMIFVNRRLFHGDRLTNEPVQVHEVDDVDKAVRIERTGGITRHETTLVSILDKDNDDIAGQHEMSRGEAVPGNKTAQEVSIIAESDKTRTRAAARVIAWSNKMLLRQLLSNMAQWTDYDWIIRIAGEDAEQSIPVNFNGSMLKREDSKGKLTDEVVEFDIRVDDYSMLPASQRDKSGLYMQLYGMVPGFPIDEFLKGLGLPNYKAIAQKIDEFNQAQMQAQSPPMGGEPTAGEIPEEAPPTGGVPVSGGPPEELMPLLTMLADQIQTGQITPEQAQAMLAGQ